MNKKNLIIFLIQFVLFVFVISSLLLIGIYIGKNNSFPLFDKSNEIKTNLSDNKEQKQTNLKLCSASTADIAEQLAESVITVSIKKLNIKAGSIDSFDYFSFFGFGQGRNIEPEYEEIESDIGTGFIAGDDKFVITNKHVVSDADAEYKIIDKNNNEFEVTKIYRDPESDIAILQVKDLQLSSAKLGDSDNIRVGDDVIAIGTALGEFRHTVTTGVISGLGRGITANDMFGQSAESLENVIQTDAAINPGNSGGPLINRCGEVIGVNVAVSSNAQNIGFAIPINVIKNTISNFNKTGKFERAFLGVNYSVISEQAALKNEVPVGAYVLEVVKDSSADIAGIQKGDIIVEFNGKKLSNNKLAKLVSETKVGDKIKTKIYRWSTDENIELEITMKENI